ncbi:uncharacterized protein LOC120351760 [Nilaparvata lugens]|uniref:uncharacterized protein LOC120351760 n=1 Tax=Nilaparvata lugens TaxID=108931 RepID=UPI00193EB605|nr:uncharacterized protein LOC120351760 [Nilaparvata lugens]
MNFYYIQHPLIFSISIMDISLATAGLDWARSVDAAMDQRSQAYQAGRATRPICGSRTDIFKQIPGWNDIRMQRLVNCSTKSALLHLQSVYGSHGRSYSHIFHQQKCQWDSKSLPNSARKIYLSFFMYISILLILLTLF